MVVARCENCGAALRVAENATSATCQYCGATALAQPVGGKPPTLRIDPAPVVSHVSVEDISALLMGGHGDTMVPIPSCTSVGGIPVTQLIDANRLEEIKKGWNPCR